MLVLLLSLWGFSFSARGDEQGIERPVVRRVKLPLTVVQQIPPNRYHGDSTTLSIATDMTGMRHDGNDYGKTIVSLRSKGGKVFFSQEINDNFECLGYGRTRRAYILQTEGERISYRVVVAFSYLSELQPKICNFDSFVGEYIAAIEAVVPSPDLRYVVFVGQKKSSPDKWRLYALDTKYDRIQLIGKAPDPPPFLSDEIESVKSMCSEGNAMPSHWNWMMMHSSAHLEPAVCRFVSNNVLQVSYGRDSWARRSKKRLIRRYTLQ
ncbi:hypothetical protein BH10CYA1_BH10CYA1_56140 [soil metagenome]